MQPRRVFVLGAGAIGASVGALLFEAGVDCVLVVRDSKHGRDARRSRPARHDGPRDRCRAGGIVAALCDDPPAEVIAAAQDEARAVWRGTGERFAEEATEKHWVPGTTSAEELRHRVLGSG